MVRVIEPKLPSPGTEPEFVIANNKPMLGLSGMSLPSRVTYKSTLLLRMRVFSAVQRRESEQNDKHDKEAKSGNENAKARP